MYENPSASIGYALYDAETDRKSYESVFRRADENMYANKRKNKSVRQDVSEE
ncbi:MAG: diguanylate cyclase [Eubacterium sp.]|nr:diguanylate cyclase [Eubacterium sp.]